MAVETLSAGFQNGYSWRVDHDETAGTIGVTVTDNGTPEAGVLTLNADVFAEPGNVPLGTITPIRIDTFDNQGRQILFSNAALKNVVLIVPKGQTPPVGLSIWTAFQPLNSATH